MVLIIAGSLVALGTTLSDPKNDRFKVTLAATAAAIAIGGGVNGYFNGVQAQKEAKASNELLRTKTDEIAAATRQSLDLAKLNGELSRALIKKSDTISDLGRSAVSETTGGDSYCFVDMGGMAGTEGLAASVERRGRYPMQNVGVTITDVDAFRADKTMQNMGVWRRSFPVIDFISRVSLWRPLGTYSMGPNVQSRSFNVEISARNGFFQELLRVRRLADGGLTLALVVTASYFDKRQGVVFQRINKTFPTDALIADKDWQTFVKMKRLKIP